ncbi:outer membrane beta-barrel protein [Bacteroidota bacterium]
MNWNIHRKIIFILLLVCLSFHLHGQRSKSGRFRKTFTLHLGSGTASYFGDLIEDGKYNSRYNINAGFMYNIVNRLTVGLDVTFFRLAGDDSKGINWERNLSFASSNMEFLPVFQVSFFDPGVRFYNRVMLNPYLFGGVGGLYYNPTAKLDGKSHALRPLTTELVEYSRFTVTYAFGAGVRFKANAFLDVILDAGFRYTGSDYLDDVSDAYPTDNWEELTELGQQLSDRSGEVGADPPHSVRGVIRGNPDRNDAYFLGNVKVAYYFSPIQDSFRAMQYKGTKRRMKKGRRRR